MPETTDIRSWYFSEGTLEQDVLTEALRSLAHSLMGASTGEGPGLIVSTASEIIARDGHDLPAWASDRATRFLVVVDVPVPATMRLPAALGLHKPQRRLHVTEDATAIRRLVVAQARSEPIGGMVDAYLLGPTLVVVLGDLSIRDFPVAQLSVLETVDELSDFRLDADGSYIEWPDADVHVDASGLLKEVDPTYVAELEIERLRTDLTGTALTEMREQMGLRQADIEGLSTRHVRRIEKGVSPLTLDAARSFAEAFGLHLGDFLDQLAAQVTDEERQTMEEARGETAAVV